MEDSIYSEKDLLECITDLQGMLQNSDSIIDNILRKFPEVNEWYQGECDKDIASM